MPDGAFVADGAVESPAAVARPVGKLDELFLESRVVAKIGKQAGIGRNHAVEGERLAAAALVHEYKPVALCFILALL